MVKKIGIIGCGVMGSAIVRSLDGFEISGFDVNREKVESLGIAIAESASELVSGSDMVLLAVKPQTYRVMDLDFGDKLVISIMAGVPLADLPDRSVRVMPNLGALVGESVNAWAPSGAATEDDRRFVREFLESFGVQIEVHSDDEIDKMTALTGCGPAYLYEFMNSLLESGKEFGLDEALVKKALHGLVSGALKAADGEDFDVMISKVASKGGTTQAALNVLGEGWGNSLKLAVKAAYARSKEL
ncbi:hypothetical protein COW94_05160 [Candidatus Peregrinibacteria bacterium CG22_combo_CG10-13_8_21_14_all_44_10]|nr:MAG: hypothetical protein AUK45_05075 [Candidatus Peregrinibacteria bacterium CG2_30_44_17]PIP65791.1 MAG: hypothetical protein COW94_05160 [Candidatus Peregrinibacteria bacterium CG22_combo_CG10-13_8_21_14_all_44_10]PIX80142.1 MAG: hypothetical protein COZ35_01685 [Candidatus Peregrinibacteria bacterium CG_4_10_14_3_um_filter_44_21]PJB88772.1 MAG: hypothetical protein CO082_03385 [Candidatus Peregrinibacteria bacterium CG_4_9_14_0_8_um_filter_44_15]